MSPDTEGGNGSGSYAAPKITELPPKTQSKKINASGIQPQVNKMEPDQGTPGKDMDMDDVD
jgi:hypothetical protein